MENPFYTIGIGCFLLSCLFVPIAIFRKGEIVQQETRCAAILTSKNQFNQKMMESCMSDWGAK